MASDRFLDDHPGDAVGGNSQSHDAQPTGGYFSAQPETLFGVFFVIAPHTFVCASQLYAAVFQTNGESRAHVFSYLMRRRSP